MKKETKIALFLLFLSPLMGEVLSASLPPISFFSPFSFTVLILLLILLYGCGTLLIRESRARWKLQWSIIFLALAYNIIEEGLIIHSFFNTGHEDLGVSAGYGMYLGVQWFWAISLTFFHATMSTLVPIKIADLLWPDYKDKPLLKKREIILCLKGLIVLILCWTLLIIQKAFPSFENYDINPLVLAGAFIVTALLIWLAYKYRNSRISIQKIPIFPSFVFGVFGFLFFIISLIIPGFLIESLSAPTTILIQVIIGILVLLFIFFQIYNKNITKRHIVSLIFGMVLFFIFLTPIQEFNLTPNPDSTQGMLAVGIIALILLILWRRKVLKYETL